MSIVISIVCWLLTVLLALCAIIYIPSISTVLFLLSALFCVPIKQIVALRSKILPKRALRIIAVVVLVIAAILTAPTRQRTADDDKSNDKDVQTIAAPETVETETEAPETETESPETEAPAQTEETTSEDVKPEEPEEPEQVEEDPSAKVEEAPQTDERADYIAECTTVDYKDVERNPQNYVGEKIKITGNVIQVSEGWFNSVTLRIETTDGVWYATYTRAEDESRILDGDRITVYGCCTGVKTYTTLLGSKMTIPSLTVEYYESAEEYQISDDVPQYGEGQHKVGTDIPAGDYMLIQNNYSWNAYYSITPDANGDTITQNDSFAGTSVVSVYDGEYLKLTHCYAVPLADAPILTPTDGWYTPGSYIVGRDIPAGEYKVELDDGEASGYYCIYSDTRKSDIVKNRLLSAAEYISITDGQVLKLSSCRIKAAE